MWRAGTNFYIRHAPKSRFRIMHRHGFTACHRVSPSFSPLPAFAENPESAFALPCPSLILLFVIAVIPDPFLLVRHRVRAAMPGAIVHRSSEEETCTHRPRQECVSRVRAKHAPSQRITADSPVVILAKRSDRLLQNRARLVCNRKKIILLVLLVKRTTSSSSESQGASPEEISGERRNFNQAGRASSY